MFEPKLNQEDFEYLLNHSKRKLRYKLKRSDQYMVRFNNLLDKLNTFPPNILSSIPSHQFYFTLRNLIRDLFLDWFFSKEITNEEISFLKKAIYFFHLLLDTISDLNQIRSWFVDALFINAIADCLSQIDRLLYQHRDKQIFKQLIHIFDLFQNYYEKYAALKLPSPLEFDSLFESTLDCLISANYDRAFRKLKSTSHTMNTEQTFFLIKCPLLISSYYGAQSKKIIDQILTTMIPRYALLLDRHIDSISQWTDPIIHVVHHLLLTVIYVKDFYTPFANGQPLRWLIDHIVRILNEESLQKKIQKNTSTMESMLLDSSLRALTTFVREPDLLTYIQNLKITSTFRSLTLLPSESIVLHGYVMLAYTLDENDIKASEKEVGRLLSKILDTLRKKMKSLSNPHKNPDLIEKHTTLLVEALRGFVQHDQIKSEILKQNALYQLIHDYEHFNHRSKRLILDSIGSITFDLEAARILRDDRDFMSSIENLQSTSDNDIHRAVEKILWNLVKATERRKKSVKEAEESKEEKHDETKKTEYLYDIMISYCHADKEVVYRLTDYLADKGYKIWVDRDNIYGPAMQAMADAVEKSEFVLICMSDSYKRSVYCQAEAEYAFRCKRNLLPCIVRQGYRADGWLGIVIGSRIYIDFGREEFLRGCELIVKEITLQRENQLLTKKDEAQSGFADAPKTATETNQLPRDYQLRNTKHSTYRSRSIRQWTNKDILDYLFDTNLQLMMPLCESMTGSGLVKLFHLCQRKPSDLYQQLGEELRKKFNGLYLSIGVYTQFLSEIDQFISSPSIHEIEEDALETKSDTTSSTTSSSERPSPISLAVPSKADSATQVSSQQITSPSLLTTIKRSRNVQIIEETDYRTQPMINPANNVLFYTSQDTPTVHP